MKITKLAALMGAGALMVATAASAQDMRIPITKDRSDYSGTVSTTPSTPTMTVSSGEVDLTTPFTVVTMNEKNITAHMAAGDSLEIELARLAQSKATDARVRDYATTLLNEHTAHLASTHEKITDEDIGAEPLPMDAEIMRMREALAKLRTMPMGASWDAAFLRFQAQHHQNEIDLMSANLKNAHDDDLEDHIEKSIQSYTRHRDTARSIGGQLGLTI